MNRRPRSFIFTRARRIRRIRSFNQPPGGIVAGDLLKRATEVSGRQVVMMIHWLGVLHPCNVKSSRGSSQHGYDVVVEFVVVLGLLEEDTVAHHGLDAHIGFARRLGPWSAQSAARYLRPAASARPS